MASLKAIRKRIASVKSTQKITKAMKMVAGARLNRAQQRILALRPYAVKTGEVLQSVADAMRMAQTEAEYSLGEAKPPHPLLAKRAEKNAVFVVLTSDRGLCGAFNTNITKATEREWMAKKEKDVQVSFVTLGRKGKEYLARKNGKIAQDFAKIYDGLDLEKARIVASWLVPRFVKGEFDSIYLVYNEFKSAITQRVVLEPLLPLPETPPDAREAQRAQFIYEPHQEGLLEKLVPMYVEISIYRALLESQASEYGARMSAMDSATRNASEMISRLTLLYNRERQAAITKELMEIIGGAEALKE
jgi:F-type H+-transporting ATPase subunit gamma